MHELLPISKDDLIAFRISDKITKDDIASMAAIAEPLIEEHGKLRLYFEMHDFHGWTISAFWSDLNFDIKHHNDFSHIAMVGHGDWQEWMAKFMQPFTSAQVKFFGTDDKAYAIAWLNSVA